MLKEGVIDDSDVLFFYWENRVLIKLKRKYNFKKRGDRW